MKLASAIFSDRFHFRFSACAALWASKYSTPRFRIRTTLPRGNKITSANPCLHKKVTASVMSASQRQCLSRIGVKISTAVLHFSKSGSRLFSSLRASRIQMAVCPNVMAMRSNVLAQAGRTEELGQAVRRKPALPGANC